MLPSYFYDINAPINEDWCRSPRWTNPYSHLVNGEGEARVVLGPGEMSEMGQMKVRDYVYQRWMTMPTQGPPLRPRKMLWQVIQIMDSNTGMWSDKYKDALFRVFVNPHTDYADDGTHRQWYLLSPEDSWLCCAYEMSEKGHGFTKRQGFKFIAPEPFMRMKRLIPVSSCRHWKHETTAGELPIGL